MTKPTKPESATATAATSTEQPPAPALAELGSAAGAEDLRISSAGDAALEDDELTLVGQRRRLHCCEGGVWSAGVWVPVRRRYTAGGRHEVAALQDYLAEDLRKTHGKDAGCKVYEVYVELEALLGLIDETGKIPAFIERVG